MRPRPTPSPVRRRASGWRRGGGSAWQGCEIVTPGHPREPQTAEPARTPGASPAARAPLLARRWTVAYFLFAPLEFPVRSHPPGVTCQTHHTSSRPLNALPRQWRDALRSDAERASRRSAWTAACAARFAKGRGPLPPTCRSRLAVRAPRRPLVYWGEPHLGAAWPWGT